MTGPIHYKIKINDRSFKANTATRRANERERY